jgi:hypothetical protein
VDQGIFKVASGRSMIHVLCHVMTTCNLQPSSGLDSRHRPNADATGSFFSCFAFASVSVTGEWERESARGKGDQTQRCSREGRGGTSRDQGRRNLVSLQLVTSLPGFHFVTHTPELGVSQGRSLPGGIERSARFRSALAFVYNDLTS